MSQLKVGRQSWFISSFDFRADVFKVNKTEKYPKRIYNRPVINGI